MLTLLVFVSFVFSAANGGGETDIDTYPFALSILHYGIHVCGGTMLKRDVVLTAALCVLRFKNEQNLEPLKVQGGTHVDKNTTGEILSSKKVHFMSYGQSVFYNVAIIRMKKNFTLGAPVETRPIYSVVPTKYRGLVIGWSLTEVPGLKGLHYHLHRERIEYLGSHDDYRHVLCRAHFPSCLDQHIGDAVVTNKELVGVTIIHNVKIQAEFYLTIAVNVTDPDVYGFIWKYTGISKH